MGKAEVEVVGLCRLHGGLGCHSVSGEDRRRGDLSGGPGRGALEGHTQGRGPGKGVLLTHWEEEEGCVCNPGSRTVAVGMDNLQGTVRDHTGK